MIEDWWEISQDAKEQWDEVSRHIQRGWDAFGDWMVTHDVTLDLIAVWTLGIGFTVFALVKIISYIVLLYQSDQGPVGRAMRPQKLAEAGVGITMSMIYWMTLWMYYRLDTFGFWTRFAIRVFIIVSLWASIIFGVRFIIALVREAIAQRRRYRRARHAETLRRSRTRQAALSAGRHPGRDQAHQQQQLGVAKGEHRTDPDNVA